MLVLEIRGQKSVLGIRTTEVGFQLSDNGKKRGFEVWTVTSWILDTRDPSTSLGMTPGWHVITGVIPSEVEGPPATWKSD